MIATGMSLATALLLGLASTLHCWGMCGGIIGALSLGLPDAVSASPRRRFLLITAFNLGRVGSYVLAGLITASLGAALVDPATNARAYLAMQLIAALVLAGVGLRLAGWLPGFALLESAGWRLWRILQPLARALMPIHNLQRALLAGAVWGWLPCALVYSMLVWSAALADPLRGAAAMFAFGLGTLPGMIGAGLAGGTLRASLQRPAVRRIAGIAVVMLGIAYALVSAVHPHHL